MGMNVCACKVLGEVRNSTGLISNDSIIPTRREEVPLSQGRGVPICPVWHQQIQAMLYEHEERLAGVTGVSMDWELQTT